MNTYPLWKYLLVLFFLVIGFVYSLPNIYPPDAALQISTSSADQALDDRLLKKIKKSLEQANIDIKSVDLDAKHVLVRLQDKEQQLKAKKIVDNALLHEYVVALNLAPTTPQWLSSIGAKPMSLGLDLSGGIHFLLEVDNDFALKKRLDGYKGQIKTLLRKEKVRGVIDEKGLDLIGRFSTEDYRDKALTLIRKEAPKLTAESYDENGAFYLRAYLSDAAKKEVTDQALLQNLTALRNRVNELGVSEPLVQRQGASRIVVELPGIQDSAQAKRIIGKTASLEFRLESDGKGSSESFAFRDKSRPQMAALERTVVITGDQVSGAQSGFDENGGAQVSITLDSQGGRLMNSATKNNIGRSLGVLFIERKNRSREVIDPKTGEKVIKRTPYYQKEVISLATIQAALGVNFRITGLSSPQEAKDLALLLRAGALAAPVDFVEERTIGPSLGEENIALGIQAVTFGMIAVLIFMLFYYKVFGLFANCALVANVFLLVAVMSILSATLTLPGIAGIVLTVGMAVDANVLIFARIKEELADGLTPQQAIEAGYNRAFTTIMDANITTFLVAIILYAVGTGPVKGFAVTLAIGIITSMFTAIVGTRALVNLVYGNRAINRLAI